METAKRYRELSAGGGISVPCVRVQGEGYGPFAQSDRSQHPTLCLF